MSMAREFFWEVGFGSCLFVCFTSGGIIWGQRVETKKVVLLRFLLDYESVGILCFLWRHKVKRLIENYNAIKFVILLIQNLT